MTRSPDDQIDPYEAQLTRRVGDFAEQAVRPIDAAAIAAAAHVGARHKTLAGRLFGSTASMSRFGVVLAGALVAAVAFGLLQSGGRPFAPGPTPGVPDASPVPTAGPTPTRVPGAPDDCVAAGFTGEIRAWEGAAGHRIATIALRNGGSAACLVPDQLRLSLFDAEGHELIFGFPCECPPFTFPAGAEATAMVDMSNFCGAAPSGALKIRVFLPDSSFVDLAPAATVRTPLDPPPCLGPNGLGNIRMQPLQLGAASS